MTSSLLSLQSSDSNSSHNSSTTPNPTMPPKKTQPQQLHHHHHHPPSHHLSLKQPINRRKPGKMMIMPTLRGFGRSHSFPPKRLLPSTTTTTTTYSDDNNNTRQRRQHRQKQWTEPTLHSLGDYDDDSNHHVQFAGTQDLTTVHLLEDHVLPEETDRVWYAQTVLQERRREDIKNNLRAQMLQQSQSKAASTTTSCCWRGLEDLEGPQKYNRKAKQHGHVMAVLQHCQQNHSLQSLAKVAHHLSQHDVTVALQLAHDDMQSMCEYQGIPEPTTTSSCSSHGAFGLLRRRHSSPHDRGRRRGVDDHHHHHHSNKFSSLAHSIGRSLTPLHSVFHNKSRRQAAAAVACQK